MTTNEGRTVGEPHMDAQIETILGQAAGESAITSPTPRETLDREVCISWAMASIVRSCM